MPLPDPTGWAPQQLLNGIQTSGYQIPAAALPYLSAEQIQMLGGAQQQNPVDAFVASLPPEIQNSPTEILRAAGPNNPSLSQAIIERFGIQNAGGMTFENPFYSRSGSLRDFATHAAADVLIPYGIATGVGALTGAGGTGAAAAPAAVGDGLSPITVGQSFLPGGTGAGVGAVNAAFGGAPLASLPAAIATPAAISSFIGAAPGAVNALASGSGTSTSTGTNTNTGSLPGVSNPAGTLSNVPKWLDYGLPAINALVGGVAADRASDAETAALDRAIAEEARQFDLTRADWQPWMDTGRAALTNLNDPQTNFLASPNYEFVRGEGTRDIQNTFAARGGGQSGNALRALAEYNSNLARGEFGDWYNRELARAGLGTTGTSAVTNARQNATGATSNFLTRQGESRASGVLGKYGAVSGAADDIYRNYLYRRRAA